MPQAIPVIISAFQAAASYAAAATFAITGSAGLASFVANTVLGVAGVTTAGLPLASAAASFIQASLLQQLMKAISPKPKNLNGGSQVRFGPNPQAPRPFIFGRTGTAGTPVVATTHGSGKNNNKWLTYIVALSCFGPVQSIEALALNQVNAPITNGMVTGGQYANRVWCTYRNGEWGQAWTPTFGPSTIPEWTPNHRGAGIAHACLTYEYDTNVFTGGAPAPVWTVQGSTGIYNASTLSLGYSANPADVYYTLLRGIESPNGNRIGVGLDAAYIDQARIAAWRAVCVANNWTCGGVWQITADNLGDVLRAILQSGGAEFAISDGKASVDFFTSAASAYTIRENDLSGDPIERPTTDRKARVSRVVPRFRSEAEGWELVPAAAVQDSTLDTEDRGRRRTDTMDFPYVSSAQQARQLAAYNLRVRRSPIVELPVKPHGIGIPCGARVTLDLPEYGISSSTGVVIKNEATATEGGLLSVRLDPADLHTWALGQDGSTISPGSMPRDPASTVQNVDPADWTASAASTTASGTTLPIIRVTGTFPNPTLARLDVQIKPNASTEWVDTNSLVAGTPALEIRSLTPNTIYNIRARYVTVGGVASPAWVNFANVTTGAHVAGEAAAGPGGAPILNSQVTGFANQIIDTEFTYPSRTWTNNFNSGGTWTFSSNTTGGVRYYRRSASNAAAGAQVNLGSDAQMAFPVVTGQRVEASVTLSWLNVSGATLYVTWYDANRGYLSDSSVAFTTTNGSTIGGFVTAPANARFAGLTVAGNTVTANISSYLEIGRPFLRIASADQTALSPYVPGPVERNANQGATIGTDFRFPDNSIAPIGRVDNLYNPIGVNQVINSDFNQGTTGFFFTNTFVYTGTSVVAGWGRNNPGYFGVRNVLWAVAAATSGNLGPAGGGWLYGWADNGFYGGLSNLNRYATRVKAGDRVFVSHLVAAHRSSTVGIEVRWFDKDGNLITINQKKIAAIPSRDFGGGDPANAQQVFDFFIAPANAAFASSCPLIENVFAGVANTYIFHADPMLCVVPENQVTPPVYTPGPVDRAADRTAEQQRSIVPQFPVIEIKQGEAGHTGNRTITHAAFAGTVGLSGGTWSLPSTNLFGGSASINSVTGIVTLWGINQSGTYTIRYTHTDGIPTDLAVNVTYVPTPSTAGASSKIFRTVTASGIASGTYSSVMSGTISSGPAGLAEVVASYLPLSWSGSLTNFQFRLTRAGTVLAETAPFLGIDGAGSITPDWASEVASLQDFYSVASGTAAWQLEARRTSGSGTINTAAGEFIVNQTPT